MVKWEKFTGNGEEWDHLVTSLSNSFYQSYGWAEVRRVSGWEPLRILARDETRVVAGASILVKRKAGAAICWIPGGPFGDLDLISSELRKTLPALLGTRLVYCRLSLLRPDTGQEQSLLETSGWKRPRVNMSSGLTMHYDLSGGEEDRLKRTTGNWRHNLKRSARHNLTVEHWLAPDLKDISSLYREMEALKSIPMQHSEDELQSMMQHLGDKVVMYRCLDADGSLLAIRAAGIFGDTAMDLLAVAGAAARKLYASHATLWALLDHCSRLGLKTYDLSGVDPQGNKGVFDFKHGTGAEMVECLGEWEWASAPGMRQAVNWLVARKTSE